MNLSGKKILITGSSGGLGEVAVELLEAQGALVIGIDIKSDGIKIDSTIVADLRDAEQTKLAVQGAIERLGGLDILINNAGVLSVQDAGMAPGQDVAEALDVNLIAPWRVVAAALPSLLESRGRVINVSSLFAVVNAPLIPAYACSKRALSAYSDILRMQYGHLIKVITLYPGYIDTPIHDGAVRQGLSVRRLVTFKWFQRDLFSLEERRVKAARGLVRACKGDFFRDRGVTFLGSLSHFGARHVPRVVSWFIGWRVGSLLGNGAMKLKLECPTVDVPQPKFPRNPESNESRGAQSSS